jgi:ribosome-binding factor A
MKKESDSARRIARVEREVQQTVARYLISGFRWPLPGIVTVARVQMPGDLRTAKVYVSVLGDPKDLDQAVEMLQKQAYEVQNYLGKELKMRYCPKLQFLADHNTQEVLKVERILQELEKERSSKNPQQSEDDSSEEG